MTTEFFKEQLRIAEIKREQDDNTSSTNNNKHHGKRLVFRRSTSYSYLGHRLSWIQYGWIDSPFARDCHYIRFTSCDQRRESGIKQEQPT